MRIWSILLIKSDFKWCIHLSRSLFFESVYIGPPSSVVLNHLTYCSTQRRHAAVLLSGQTWYRLSCLVKLPFMSLFLLLFCRLRSRITVQASKPISIAANLHPDRIWTTVPLVDSLAFQEGPIYISLVFKSLACITLCISYKMPFG